MIISNSIGRHLFIIMEWQHGLTSDSDITHMRCRNSNFSHDRPLLIFKKGDCLYRGGHAEESGDLKSLQSAKQKADNVGTCDKMNNESLENNVTCDDLFPGVNAYRNKYKRNFIFLHVNINSFRHKFAPMQPILSNRKVDLLVISKSKLDSTFPNTQFNVVGFCIY